MTEPTTPTGKRLLDKAYSSEPGAIYLAGLSRDDILAIEREAAEQEADKVAEVVTTAVLQRLRDIRRAERALADQLAEALRQCLWQLDQMSRAESIGPGWKQANRECVDECKSTLAAYEEAR